MTMSANETELKNTNEVLLEKIKYLEEKVEKLQQENKMNKLNSEQMIEKLKKDNKIMEIKYKQSELEFKERIRGMEDTIDVLCGNIQELKNKIQYKN